MTSLISALKLTPVVYVTRDLERALGLPLNTPNYYIVTNAVPKSFSPGITKNILYIPEKAKLDTRELLQHPATIRFIDNIQNRKIVVFKNITQIENICREHNWDLINPPAELASRVEEKISQLEWLDKLQKYLPPHYVTTGENLVWKNEPYIVQFNRAHTGSGTILITSEEQIAELKKTFPKREVRVTTYINGASFTNNNIVWGRRVLLGNINYQITGLSPFTDKPFATIGNDWSLPTKVFTDKQTKKYQKMAEDIGLQLAKSGWKGLFGIDTVLDTHTGRLYLIEINARQPASTSYESELQQNKTNKKNISTFEAHLLSLLNYKDTGEQLVKIKEGSQIVQRITPFITEINKRTVDQLNSLGINQIKYDNHESGQDLLRIQSKTGILLGHNRFNWLGTQISFACDYNKHRGYRAGVIFIKNKRVLLMKKIRPEEQFYMVTGGKPENDETLLQAAIREAAEETSLIFSIDKNKQPICLQRRRREAYFFAKNIQGAAKLGGPELQKIRPGYSFILEWIDKKTLKKIKLRQVELKPLLSKFL